MQKIYEIMTHTSPERIFDARTVAGSTVTALGVGLSVKELHEQLQMWATAAGLVLTLATLVYVGLGIIGRVRQLRSRG